MENPLHKDNIAIRHFVKWEPNINANKFALLLLTFNMN